MNVDNYVFCVMELNNAVIVHVKKEAKRFIVKRLWPKFSRDRDIV